jgi:hypothetical protein
MMTNPYNYNCNVDEKNKELTNITKLLFSSKYLCITEPLGLILNNANKVTYNDDFERITGKYYKPFMKEHHYVDGLWVGSIHNKSKYYLKKTCSHLFGNFCIPYYKNKNDVIELGISLLSLETDDPKFKFISFSHFGDVREIFRFIAWEIARLNDSIPKNTVPTMIENLENIQITIRRYKKGQGIGPHIDRIDKFTDRIFTVVVQSNSRQGLIFTSPNGNQYQILEENGQFQIQTGESRYQFNHQLKNLKSNEERISITWRFFREDYISQFRPGNYRHPLAVRKMFQKVEEYTIPSFSFWS